MRMLTNAPWILALLAPLAACASTIDRARLRSELAQEPLSGPQGLAEIEGLRPSLEGPIVLAVAPPRSSRSEQRPWEGSRETLAGMRSWSQRELAVIESWERPLSELGLVSDLLVMPVLLVEPEEGRGLLDTLRLAAARHGAGAVLVVSEVEDSSTWLNPWSILDITIIAAWFAPGHEVEVVTILEGALIDTHTGYLFASGQAEGTARGRRAWAYADDPELRHEARCEALAGLEQVVLQRARALGPARPGSGTLGRP